MVRTQSCVRGLSHVIALAVDDEGRPVSWGWLKKRAKRRWGETRGGEVGAHSNVVSRRPLEMPPPLSTWRVYRDPGG
eukprot:COSAG01_NODE_29986_length_625_cov_2.688213_1_plen_77_part_00